MEKEAVLVIQQFEDAVHVWFYYGHLAPHEILRLLAVAQGTLSLAVWENELRPLLLEVEGCTDGTRTFAGPLRIFRVLY
jgi:hypothetical protein